MIKTQNKKFIKKTQNKKFIKKIQNKKFIKKPQNKKFIKKIRKWKKPWKKPETLSGWKELKWGETEQKKKQKNKQIFLKTKLNIFYPSYWFIKFINKLMQRGRKAIIEKIVLCVFKNFKVKHHKNALKIFFSALTKNRPILWFAPIRIGRQIKKVPIPLSPRKQLIMSLKWFTHAAKLVRYRAGNISTENVLNKQLEEILKKEKTILTIRRTDHLKELLENRVNLYFRQIIKK